MKNFPRIMSLIGPGMLVAATGVGAGDLITASLGGSAVGVSILWAALAGAVLKWFLNEGIARWQMATGTTLLEGWNDRLGRWIQWVFLIYLVCWTFVTGGALVTACGVAGTGLLPLSPDPATSKIIWGVIHSFAGLLLVRMGGFKLFERLMAACIGLMFISVLVTAVASKPDWAAVGRGLVTPSMPATGSGWVVGLLGGVGGTLTILSYGYWIREAGRSGMEGVKTCRIDLGVGYAMTALFGIAMVIIGSQIKVSGSGSRVAIALADQLGAVMGPAGKWIFLAGFWGAVFSSLLGVWQSVPYMFADFLFIRRGMTRKKRDTLDFKQTTPYRLYLYAITIVPLPLLWTTVKQAQLAHAILGALFMPLLALTLLILNNRESWVGRGFRNGWITNLALVATLLLFAAIGISELREAFQPAAGTQ